MALVDQIIETKQKLIKAKTDNEAAYLERRFDSLDERINQLVSAQYGLTLKDVEIINAAMK